MFMIKLEYILEMFFYCFIYIYFRPVPLLTRRRFVLFFMVLVLSPNKLTA